MLFFVLFRVGLAVAGVGTPVAPAAASAALFGDFFINYHAHDRRKRNRHQTDNNYIESAHIFSLKSVGLFSLLFPLLPFENFKNIELA